MRAPGQALLPALCRGCLLPPASTRLRSAQCSRRSSHCGTPPAALSACRQLKEEALDPRAAEARRVAMEMERAQKRASAEAAQAETAADASAREHAAAAEADAQIEAGLILTLTLTLTLTPTPTLTLTVVHREALPLQP